MFEIKIPMTGLKGFKKVEIPSNYMKEYQFVTLMNLTDNSTCIYPSNVTEPTAGMSIICVGQYGAVTIPMSTDLQLGFNIVWTNPSGTNLDIVKTAKVIFSEENLNYNTSYAPSFTAGGDVVNTAIVADDIGLTKASQLPGALTTAGNLKTGIVEDAVGIAKANQLPGALTTAGNLKAGIMEDAVGIAKASQLPTNLTTRGNLSVEPAIPLETTNSWAGVTTDTYAQIGSIWDKRGLKNAWLQVTNSGANGGKVKVLGSLDNVTFVEIVAEQVIPANSSMLINIQNYVSYLRIDAVSQTAGLATNLSIVGVSLP